MDSYILHVISLWDTWLQSRSLFWTLLFSRCDRFCFKSVFLFLFHSFVLCKLLYYPDIHFVSHSNRNGGVMVSVLASSAVDCEFEPRSGQTKENKIGICCFSATHAALRRKSKDWLAWNQSNVSIAAIFQVWRVPRKWISGPNKMYIRVVHQLT
jgi:hypothetical protein